jgi:hypothetical protein
LPLPKTRPQLLLLLPVWRLGLRLQLEPLVPLLLGQPERQEQERERERVALDPRARAQAQVLLLAVQAQARGVKEKVTWLK